MLLKMFECVIIFAILFDSLLSMTFLGALGKIRFRSIVPIPAFRNSLCSDWLCDVN